MIRCKGCGENIYFIRGLQGKTIPCETQKVVYFEDMRGKQRIITKEGYAIRAAGYVIGKSAVGDVGYIPHNCPAKRNRKGF